MLSELRLRDDGVYALLFRFLGFGFRLAMSNVGWLVTQKFVSLVPDPIAFAPRPALLDPGDLATSVNTLLSGLVFVLVLAAEAAQRLRLDEEQEEHGQERLAL